MKMINNIIIFFCCTLLFTNCDNKYDVKDPNDTETINSGKLTIYCDDAVYNLLDSGFLNYNKQYPNVILTKVKANARNSMAYLLAGKTRVSIIARDYLKDEDSLMKVYKVVKHQRVKIADDALVLFVRKDFPLDTLNIVQVRKLFQLKDYSLNNDFKEIKKETKISITSVNSSIFSNFEKLILQNQKLTQNLNYFLNLDSVKLFVLKNNGIGIGLMSEFVSDTNFKILRIGFQDSSNKYISPKPVHQGYLVQNKYPFKVSIYVYLFEERQNLPFWFATYMGKEFVVQKYLLNRGLVPAYANLKLKISEE